MLFNARLDFLINFKCGNTGIGDYRYEMRSIPQTYPVQHLEQSMYSINVSEHPINSLI